MKRVISRSARIKGVYAATGLHRRAAQVMQSAAALVVWGIAAVPAYAQCEGEWTRRMPAAAPSARSNLQMAYDSARGVTVLFGGGVGDSTDPSTMNNETWEWNGTNWSQKTPAAMPSVRTSYGMAYDSARGRTVLFGGYVGGAGENGETWEWNGTNWSQKSPVPAPSARFAHAMAFDSARGVTVLFGGSFDDGMGSVVANNETWEWNGTTWTQRLPGLAPSARAGHAMAYDSARDVAVLFAGSLDAGTHEWNGTTWASKSPAAAPSARFYHAMAFDSVRGVTVLFGGTSGGGETWEWNGTNWSQKSPAPAPSSRYYHAMAYDSDRKVVVLFGGLVIGAGNSNETWEWSIPTFEISQQPAEQTVGVGQAAVFSVAATGPGVRSYEWRMNGNPLADGGVVSGSATDMLLINPAAVENTGMYDCWVGSSKCAAVLSASAALVVDPCKAVGTTGDADGNGVLDSCDAAAGACGACGAGVATMMPLGAFLFLGARLRHRR